MAPPPLGHEMGGFNPSMLLNAQLALQAAAMAAAMASTSGTTTPATSIFSSAPPTTGHAHEAGTLHSMEKMVAGINGTNE